MKNSLALTSMEFSAGEILGKLVTSPRTNKYLLVMSDRYSKLVLTVQIQSIIAKSVVNAFVTYWVMDYDPPRRLLSNNGKQITSKFFQHIWKILGIEIVLATS